MRQIHNILSQLTGTKWHKWMVFINRKFQPGTVNVTLSLIGGVFCIERISYRYYINFGYSKSQETTDCVYHWILSCWNATSMSNWACAWRVTLPSDDVLFQKKSWPLVLTSGKTHGSTGVPAIIAHFLGPAFSFPWHSSIIINQYRVTPTVSLLMPGSTYRNSPVQSVMQKHTFLSLARSCLNQTFAALLIYQDTWYPENQSWNEVSQLKLTG